MYPFIESVLASVVVVFAGLSFLKQGFEFVKTAIWQPFTGPGLALVVWIVMGWTLPECGGSLHGCVAVVLVSILIATEQLIMFIEQKTQCPPFEANPQTTPFGIALGFLALFGSLGWLLWGPVSGGMIAGTVLVSVLFSLNPCLISMAHLWVYNGAIQVAAREGLSLKKYSLWNLISNLQVILLEHSTVLGTRVFRVEGWVVFEPQLTAKVTQAVEVLVSKSDLHCSGAFNKTSESVQGLTNESGMGVSGLVNGELFYVGKAEWLLKKQIVISSISYQLAKPFQVKGSTVLWVASQQQLLGFWALKEEANFQAIECINTLKNQGLKVVLVTENIRAEALSIAHEFGIDNVMGDVLKEERKLAVKQWQNKGSYVAYVGTSEEALSQAQLGCLIEGFINFDADLKLLSFSSLTVMKPLSRLIKTIDIQNKAMVCCFYLISLGVSLGLFHTYLKFTLLPFFALGFNALGIGLVVLNSARLFKKK